MNEMKKEVVAMLLAGGQGSRLYALTSHVAKPAVPFGGKYRIIDFPLSNCVNSGIDTVGVLTQYRPLELNSYIGSGQPWDLDRSDGGVHILPPYMREGDQGTWYKGTANAIYQNIGFLDLYDPDYVVILSGDHIDKMDYADMVVNLPVAEVFQQHLDSGADITILCTQELKGAPRNTVYITQGPDGLVSDLSINPAHAANALESLETYIISKKLLLDMVDYCAAHNIHNFSRGVLLPRLSTLKVLPYLHRGYVARFQSVADYFQHSMDLLDPAVRADLFDPDRPIRTKDQSNPSTYYGPDAKSIHSLVADGCFIEGEVENSILSRGVIVEAGAKVSNSVLMQGTIIRAGASLSYTITDKNVQVNQDRMLMGHSTYPLAISKDSIV